MHKILLSTALVLSLAGGATAMAKTKTASADKTAPSATASKSAECARQWKAEKTHTQTRKVFLAACSKA